MSGAIERGQPIRGRLAIQQRVISAYRKAFLEALAARCVDGLHLFGGHPTPEEPIKPIDGLEGPIFTEARNRFLLGGPVKLVWQHGAMDWLRGADPDVLVCEANARYLVTRRMRRWMHARRRPVLGWGLGTYTVQQSMQAARSLGREGFLRGFDGMIAYSSRAAREYAAVGIPEDRIVVAPNSTKPRPARRPPERPDRFTDRPVVLFVGRINEGKRLPILIEAIASLPEADRPVLEIVGDGPAREAAESLAKEILPEARFLGSKYGAELDPIFARADLFVLPGLGGLAMQEAMAHGLPIVVADGDGTQEDLVRPGNGWNVEPGNLADLRDTIADALSDPARLRAMGEASFRIVDEELNVDAMVDAFARAMRITMR